MLWWMIRGREIDGGRSPQGIKPSLQRRPGRASTSRLPRAIRMPALRLITSTVSLAQRSREVKWVTDTTAISTAEGWLYLAVILDLFSRRARGLVHSCHRR